MTSDAITEPAVGGSAVGVVWGLVSRSGDRWVRYDEGRIEGDQVTASALRGYDGAPVPLGFSGAAYEATGPDDPGALFVLAEQIVGFGATLTGTPPPLPGLPPASEGPTPPGIVY